MKKIFTTIILLFVVTINSFAGEYVYWENKKSSPSGRITAHVKICCPKNFMDNKTANAILSKKLDSFCTDFGNWVQNHEITDIYLSNHYHYLVGFTWDYNSSTGCIRISGGQVDAFSMYTIYDSGYCFESYNTLLDFYKKKCSEYLSMI